MSIVVQGTAEAPAPTDPTTEVSEPSSPVNGPAVTVGQAQSVPIGPFSNNSSVTLNLTEVTVSDEVNCTVSVETSLPVSVNAGTDTNVVFNVNATAAGDYGFGVQETWSE